MNKKQIDDLEYQRKLVDLKRELISSVYGHAAAYDNILLLAGYAAFFGLWAGIAKDVTPMCRVTVVALMGLSLMSYIAFQIVQMLHRQTWEHEQFDAFDELEDDPQQLFQALADAKKRYDARMIRVLRMWSPSFYISLVAGFGAAIILIWNAVVWALDVPLQLVRPW